MFTYILILFLISGALCRRHNIIFIVADDLGWNDVSWHNPSVITPNLHRLYRRSIRLENYYVQPTCSPSRAAFLTGIFPHKIGMTEEMPSANVSGCLDTHLNILPQVLRSAGYSTHLIGKWHLGFCDWRCTPTYRGYDSFYGGYDGHNDHYSHRHGAPWLKHAPNQGLDFRDNQRIVLDQNGTYSAHSFTNRALTILHQSTRPFFLQLSYTLPHFPVQSPRDFMEIYANNTNLTENRKAYLGMVSALDSSIGRVVGELDRLGLWDDTVLIFTSDNGGEVRFGGNNWPLRGQKYGVFEGGTRSPAFVITPNMRARHYNNLFHAVDWFTTIQSAAGINVTSSTDSADHWSCFHGDCGESPRNEFIYNIRHNSAAMREGRFKLILGDPDPLICSYDWYPDNFTPNSTSDPSCDQFTHKTWLFDLEADPEERINVKEELPGVVRELRMKLEGHIKEYKPGRTGQLTLVGNADPEYWGDVWSPGWCIAD